MKRILFLLAFGCLSTGALAQSITACDWEVAHPSDPDHVGPGRSSGEVDTQRAILACEAAVESHPDVARFHYQLGRALVYHADAAGEDASVGMPHLLKAAELGSAQARFVYGLMLKRFEDACRAEPWIKKAAHDGLKSARITYVDDYLAGRYRECPAGASASEMKAYLDGARSQVSGYYEGLLLNALQRQLAAGG